MCLQGTKTLFLDSLNFLSLLYSSTGYLFPYEESNFSSVNRMLNVRVRHDKKIYRLAIYDIGGVQVGLAEQSLEKLKNLMIYDFPSGFVTTFKRLSSFLQPSGSRCDSLSVLLW